MAVLILPPASRIDGCEVMKPEQSRRRHSPVRRPGYAGLLLLSARRSTRCSWLWGLSLASYALIVALVGGACAAPTSPASPTPQPTPVPSGNPLGIAWAPAARIGDAGSQALPAFTEWDGQTLLVGALVGDELETSLWASSDGLTWVRSRDANVNGLDIVDVAARPGRFVAVALPPNEYSRGGILASDNGRDWRMVHQSDTLIAVAAGRDEFLVLDQAGVLVSSDGQEWTSVGASVEAQAGSPKGALTWTDVEAAPWGWVAIGGTATDPAIWASTDGVEWRLATIEEPRSGRATGGASADEVACSTHSCLVTGSEWGDGDNTWRVAWSSIDGRIWARLPDDGAASNKQSSRVVAWDDRLVVVLDGEVLVSDDGSRWRPMSIGSLPSDVRFIDAAAAGNAILLVGRQRTNSGDVTYQVTATMGRLLR